MSPKSGATAESPQFVNEVRVQGHVSCPPESKVLPSGDEVVTFRVVIGRGTGAKSSTGRNQSTVDTLDVACWTARTRRTALGLRPGDLAQVEGALRRRFWRTPTATASKTEIEATSLRRA